MPSRTLHCKVAGFLMGAMTRVAEWMAHWFEQLREHKLYRPGQIYEGNMAVLTSC